MLEVVVIFCLRHCYQAKMRQNFIVRPPNHPSRIRARRYAQSRIEAPAELECLESPAELPSLEAQEEPVFRSHVPPRPSILPITNSTPLTLNFWKNPLAYFQIFKVISNLKSDVSARELVDDIELD